MKFNIEVAKRSSSKARIALCGPSGSGKTYTALELARGMVDGDASKIVLIDSENRSAAKYADGKWRHLVLPDFSLKTYRDAILYAAKRCEVLIIDSLSHAWIGPGGALEQAESEQSRNRNKMEAWRIVTPLQLAMLQAILTSPCHVIATMRTKVEWAFDRNDRGRTVPRKLGTKPMQRDGVEYEFDIVAYLSGSHTLTVEKTRCPELDGMIVQRPNEDLGRKILGWLSDVVSEDIPEATPSKKVETEPLQEADTSEQEIEFDGSEVTRLRKMCGMDVEALSALSMVSPKLILDHERGRTPMSQPVLDLVMQILDTALQRKHEKTLTHKGESRQTVEPESDLTPAEALDRIQELFGVDRGTAWHQYFLPELREQFGGKVSKETLTARHVQNVMDVLEDLGDESRKAIQKRSLELSELTAISQMEAKNVLRLRCDVIGPRFAKNIEKAFDALIGGSKNRSESAIF